MKNKLLIFITSTFPNNTTNTAELENNDIKIILETYFTVESD